MLATIEQTAHLLGTLDDILILTHKNPDGDTLGAGFALLFALLKAGKRARVENPDGFPKKYSYMTDGYQPETFEPKAVVAVDIASVPLMGEEHQIYADRVDLCIDHHPSNTFYAKNTLLDPKAAATCEIIYTLLKEMGAGISGKVPDALYTGIITDTGCFQYSNTTAGTHMIAAELIRLGARHVLINRMMFSSKTKEQFALERDALCSLSFYCGDRIAMITVPFNVQKDILDDPGAFDGISALPRQIAGVEAGVTLREQADGGWKVSLRTTEYIDASLVCSAFGGGGHKRAAGCTVCKPEEEVKSLILDALSKEL